MDKAGHILLKIVVIEGLSWYIKFLGGGGGSKHRSLGQTQSIREVRIRDPVKIAGNHEEIEEKILANEFMANLLLSYYPSQDCLLPSSHCIKIEFLKVLSVHIVDNISNLFSSS